MVDRNLIEKTIKEYNNVNALFKDRNIGFMNHGYSPSSTQILEEDFLFKNQTSLYLNLFNDIDTTNKKVLEVGCGRGGGISAVAKYLNIKNLSACDINALNIEYCKKSYDGVISFKVSDAHSLEYDSDEFDIVLSVESSHCYPSPALFFNEVSRVLKNDGLFLYADCGSNIRSFKEYSELFEIIIEEDITENVMQSCLEDYEKWKLSVLDKDIKEKFTEIALLKSEEYSSGSDGYLKYIARNKKLGEDHEQV
jgi:ubiquinone/menaquinone biosynthesis C-methylase UbiE